MKYDLVAIQYIGDFRLEVTFCYGTSGVSDGNPYLKKGGIFAPLTDESFFKETRIDMDWGGMKSILLLKHFMSRLPVNLPDPVSMSKMTFAGEDHGHVVLVRLVDAQLVVLGAAGLGDGGDAGSSGLGDVVGEGKEGV